MESNKIDANQWRHIVKTAEAVDGYDQYFFNRLWAKLHEQDYIMPAKIRYTQEAVDTKMEEAKEYLVLAGCRKELINRMSVLTFLALCGIKPDTKWKHIKIAHMTLTKGIMQFVADNYNIEYKSNTRESFRREGINPLLSQRVIDLNPGNANLGPNSPLTHYALSPKALGRIKSGEIKG